MCGIFGYAKRQNAHNDKQLETIKNVLTNLADESVVRGTDSTGVTMISPTDRRTFKSTLPCSVLLSGFLFMYILLMTIYSPMFVYHWML